MPNQVTVARAKKAKREGKAASTQAGEFIKETIDDIRSGKIGAKSTKQAIAIGLSKARRAGVALPPPKAGKASEETRQKAKHDSEVGRTDPNHAVNKKRSKAATAALKREGKSAASHEALSRQAKEQAKKRTASERSRIGRKAAKTRMKKSRPSAR